MATQSPRASRGATSNPFGKLTAEVGKFKLPEETYEILDREAKAIGMNVTEFVRELCIVRAHGVAEVSKVHAERVRVVAGMRRE